MQQYLQNKKGLVQNVFDQVYDRYDLMNDFMSLGIHRLWKKSMLNMMNPSAKLKLIDVACGTGDIANLFLKHVDKKSEITCIDPNKKMISKAKKFEKKNKTEKAQKHYKKAIGHLLKHNKKFPSDPDTLNYLGFAHRKVGDYENAEIYYSMGLALDPKHVGINEYLSLIHI